VFRCVLSSKSPSILWIPPNHANGFMTLSEETVVQFFSTSSLEDSLNDDIRYAYDKWNIWDIEYR
jgi:dTDP-4-dehydrorhamnose 3,5-epimerase-like enzyme